MNPNAHPLRQAFGLPLGTLRWPHLQRLAERWLRRWGFALSGFALGLCAVWLADPAVGEDHAHAAQTVARLQQQLAASPEAAVKPEKPLTPEAQSMLASLPGQIRQGHIGADWQRVLAAHGLRLQSLRPLPPTLADERHGGLPSQAVALRWLGRFEDWSSVWAACALTGPVCTIDRISVVATADPTEVQIDAVLRVWMRSDQGDEGGERLDPANGWPGRAVSMARAVTDPRPSGRSGVALFASGHEGAASLAGSVVRVAASAVHGADGTAGAVGVLGALGASDTAALDALPEDPRQWPLARVRVAGLWQQGADRQAVLSAGRHWATVSLGQRVTLEGHRVVAITGDSVSLRLAQGPLLKLDWLGDKGRDAQRGESPKDGAQTDNPKRERQPRKGDLP